MIPMKLEEIASFTGGTLIGADGTQFISEIVTDSRRITPGCLFVALKGEQFDGHAFVGQAVEQGALAAVVCDDAEIPDDCPVLRVGNTLTALGRIGAGYLKQYHPGLRRVAVTGSVGKTSTKDMIAHVLEASYQTCKTPMNFNNEIGLPLTLLRLREGDQALVAEMGMRGFGQIRYLTELVDQDLAVITNIGTSHLELLGTRENILRAKMEVCVAGQGARTNKPYRLIVNGDNDLLSDSKKLKRMAREYGCNHLVVIPFGFSPCCAYRATDLRIDGESTCFTLWCDTGHFTVRLPVPGEHHVYNALAAVACAVTCGISVERAVARLASWGEDAARQRILRFGEMTVLDDTYNASPESMRASLNVLSRLECDYRIAVLGDMLELGEASKVGHLETGALAGEVCDSLISVGTLAEGYEEGFFQNKDGPVCHFETSEAAVPETLRQCKEKLSEGLRVAVLVKGSHSMRMERVSEGISDYFNHRDM